MKRFLFHIISFVLSGYFLLAGLGFNLVEYCCNGCRNAGIEFVAEHSCTDIHTHNGDACCSSTQDYKNQTISIAHSHKDHCTINRFSVETPVFSFSQLLSNFIFQPAVLQVFVNNLLADSSVFENINYLYPPPFLTSSGRNILSLKSVLII